MPKNQSVILKLNPLNPLLFQSLQMQYKKTDRRPTRPLIGGRAFSQPVSPCMHTDPNLA